MGESAIKVGVVARRTGVTVRTLHHYDAIGLLSPSRRTPSGHRLYAAGDIARLGRIRSLRQLGFSLDEIRDCLDRGEISLEETLRLHIDRLRERIGAQEQICRRLERLAAALGDRGQASVDDLLNAVKEITMFEKYYTPEQLATLGERAEKIGEERMRQVQDEWAELFRRFDAERRRGAAPDSDAVQELARRARGLIEEFTGGDAGIERSLAGMYRQEGPANVLEPHEMAVEPSAFEFMNRAMAAARKTS